jgi:DNA-binding beta-propeller fold protein YncE
VDRHQNVWIVHRRIDLGAAVRGEQSQSTVQFAPPVLEFAPDGTLLASWGGPGRGYDWPAEEHGIYVDLDGDVWLGGAGIKDDQILKFTSQGRFLLQIGHPGQSHGSNDTENLGGPATMVVDEEAHELYVADGYVNHRVIVFDTRTGAYKRHWGAYGKRPDDSYYERAGIRPGQHTMNGSDKPPSATPPPQFDLVHTVRISKDGLVYVGDRTNNRIQVFRKDGTFLQESFLANDVLGSGSTSDIGFSLDPQQRFALVLNSTKGRVYVLERKSLKVLSTFGEPGKLPGQFEMVHNLAVNAKGDLFITEARGSRLQKFVRSGSQGAN